MKRSHRLVISLAFLFAGGLVGCGASVSGSVGEEAGELARYKSTWSHDWRAINEASEPWNSTGDRPGACDKGGEAKLCHDTDLAVAAGLTSLREHLEAATAPKKYQRANELLIAALEVHIRGLEGRAAALADNQASAFAAARSLIAEGAKMLVAAYREFPANDRPTPALFGQGRHAG